MITITSKANEMIATDQITELGQIYYLSDDDADSEYDKELHVGLFVCLTMVGSRGVRLLYRELIALSLDP